MCTVHVLSIYSVVKDLLAYIPLWHDIVITVIFIFILFMNAGHLFYIFIFHGLL